MIVRFHPEAELDLQDSIKWYANHKNGLDSEFMLCVDEAIARIKRNPLMYPVALRNTRKILLKRFPYTIFYRIGEAEIMILAVYHSKRDPKVWKKREL